MIGTSVFSWLAASPLGDYVIQPYGTNLIQTYRAVLARLHLMARIGLFILSYGSVTRPFFILIFRSLVMASRHRDGIASRRRPWWNGDLGGTETLVERRPRCSEDEEWEIDVFF